MYGESAQFYCKLNCLCCFTVQAYDKYIEQVSHEISREEAEKSSKQQNAVRPQIKQPADSKKLAIKKAGTGLFESKLIEKHQSFKFHVLFIDRLLYTLH